MTKYYREITDISVTYYIDVSKKRYLKRRYDTENVNIGDVSRYFRYNDPSLIHNFSPKD